MKNVRRGMLAAVAALVLTAGIARATVVGVVDAISKRDVTVTGVVYGLDDDVELQDMSGQAIKLPEIRPGVHVELDFDEDGKLTVIRAAVVR